MNSQCGFVDIISDINQTPVGGVGVAIPGVTVPLPLPGGVTVPVPGGATIGVRFFNTSLSIQCLTCIRLLSVVA